MSISFSCTCSYGSPLFNFVSPIFTLVCGDLLAAGVYDFVTALLSVHLGEGIEYIGTTIRIHDLIPC